MVTGRQHFDTLRRDVASLRWGHTASDMLPMAAALRGGVERSLLPLHILATGEMAKHQGTLPPRVMAKAPLPPRPFLGVWHI